MIPRSFATSVRRVLHDTSNILIPSFFSSLFCIWLSPQLVKAEERPLELGSALGFLPTGLGSASPATGGFRRLPPDQRSEHSEMPLAEI